jgi:signal transduction histidine kinase
MLHTLVEGDFFGEYALIHEAPRMATVETLTPTTVVEIYKEDFQALLKSSTSVSMAMVGEVSRRLRENDEMAIEDLRLKAGELAVAYQQLAELDFARREFLTTIAHELRTPLTAASGFVDIIQQGHLKGEALTGALGTVAKNLQKIINLVNDILFMQELELILEEPERMNVGSTVVEVVRKQQEAIETGNLTILLQEIPALPDVIGDRQSLERAISAVLENAVKFSPEGGVIHVQALHEKGQVLVRVADQGVGIPEETIPHLFDRYFHLENLSQYAFGGAGLGLSIAHEVITRLGGDIQVESEPGAGSVFTIRLPAASA